MQLLPSAASIVSHGCSDGCTLSWQRSACRVGYSGTLRNTSDVRWVEKIQRIPRADDAGRRAERIHMATGVTVIC